MKMQRYDFMLTYSPGNHMILADALSRTHINNGMSSTTEDVQYHVNIVFNLSSLKLKCCTLRMSTVVYCEARHFADYNYF